MFHAKIVYDKKFNSCSRVRPDYELVKNVDEDGNEHIVFELVNYPKIQESLGSFDMWSVTSLMKAGIDPRFNIKTGFNTRLDGFAQNESAVAMINAKLDEAKNVESEKSE